MSIKELTNEELLMAYQTLILKQYSSSTLENEEALRYVKEEKYKVEDEIMERMK